MSLAAEVGARRELAVGTLAALALAAVVALPTPHATLWALLAVGAAALAALRPRALCYLLPAAVALDTVVTLAAGPLRAGPTDLVTGALALGGLARAAPRLRGAADGALAPRARWEALRSAWRREPAAAAVAAALLAYLAVIVLSVVVAADRVAVAKEALKWGEALAVFATARFLLDTPARRTLAAWCMVGVGVAEALLGYAQWALATGELGAGSASLRVFGTFDQPNPYAADLNLALPLALGLAVYERRPPQRWAAAGAAVLLAGAQVLADSRGGLLALAAALAVMLVVAAGIERPALALGAGAAALAALGWATGLLPRGLERRALDALRLGDVSLGGPLNDGNFSSVERLAHWVAGLRMFAAHPLLGVGAGNYAAAYDRYKVPGWDLALGHAHDYYINAAAETGAIGLAAFLALTAAGLFLAWSAARAAGGMETAAAGGGGAAGAGGGAAGARAGRPALLGGGTERGVALGALGVVIAVAVHNLVDDVFVHGMVLQVALCLALAAGVLRSSLSPRSPAPLSPRERGQG